MDGWGKRERKKRGSFTRRPSSFLFRSFVGDPSCVGRTSFYRVRDDDYYSRSPGKEEKERGRRTNEPLCIHTRAAAAAADGAVADATGGGLSPPLSSSVRSLFHLLVAAASE